MKRLLSIALILFTALTIQAQDGYVTKSKKAMKLFEEGFQMYRAGYPDEALIALDEALEEDPDFPDPYIIKAQIFEDRYEYERALENYQAGLDRGPSNGYKLYLIIGELQVELLQLPEAINNLNTYLQEPSISNRSEERALMLLELAKYRKTLMDHPVNFDPINAGSGVNTPNMEHSPTLTADLSVMYFTRKEKTDRYNASGIAVNDEDLYVSLWRDGVWGMAQNLGPSVNSGVNEGASCISPDGRYLFLTACNRRDSKGSCDIYLAMRDGHEVKDSKNIGEPINSRYWESQPSFSSDGRTLYFVSNRPGGKGGKDIWVSSIGDDGRWSEPKNLEINTPGDDQSPFIHPNGHSLYFSSDGYMGMGGADLFKCEIHADSISFPQNLGYPINSNGSEVSLIVTADGRQAFYASKRDGGFGEWDIYSFELPEDARPSSVTFVKGITMSEATGKPMKAKFELIDLSTGERIVESYSDPKTGEFLVCIPMDREYALNASAEGFIFFSENFDLQQYEKSEAFAFNVPMKPLVKGQRQVLKNIFYATGDYNLEPESEVELQILLQFLNDHPDLRIEIGGHTDNVGSLANNQTLSEKRAQSVYNYLIEHGIPEARLEYKGYNFSRPIADNDTEEGRRLNRRTEFTIL